MKAPLHARTAAILERLDEHYRDAECALKHANPLQLLVATILSAQCTDERVNKVTPALFREFPDAAAFARSDAGRLEEAIRTTGFFKNKAKNIKACCRELVEKHRGKVPARLEALVMLPGVGRKTANVVLGTAFGIPGITVDTHLGRVSRRLGLTKNEDPVKVEFDLMRIIPERRWSLFSLQMIWHGRRVCAARKPLCSECFLRELCPFPTRAAAPLPPGTRAGRGPQATAAGPKAPRGALRPRVVARASARRRRSP